jgi:hypothetical protein
MRKVVTGGSQRAIVLSVLLAAPGAAIAVDEHHPPEKGATAAATPMKMEQMQDMQAHMLKMHEQMHKIMGAKSPAEREKLMQEHRTMMQEHMKTMRGPGGMMGGGMMGNGMQKPMDGMKKGPPSP